jgi:diguanylate cyclase (GGDEF)-like protein
MFGISVSAKDYIVYVNSQVNDEFTKERWSKTIEYLNENITQHNFKLLPIQPNNIEKIKDLISKKEIDFILTQPAIYTEIEHNHKTIRMLTLSNKYDMSEFGSVIFTHKDSNIKNIQDIKGKSVAAIAPMGFGGWLIGYDELYKNGIDPLEDDKVVFLGSQKKVLEDVLNKKYDVGIVRTGMIEKLSSKKNIDIKNLKVINQIQNDKNIYLSTELYPEWAFAAAGHVEYGLINKVFKVLNSIDENSEAAKSGEYTHWHIPGNYTKVDDLFKKFRLGHYKNMPQYTKEELRNIIAVIVVFTTLTILLLIMFIRNMMMKDMKKKLTSEVIEKTKELKELNEELNIFFDVIPDITIVNDGKKMLKANKEFYTFTGFKNYEEFHKKHECICELFEKREGYIQSEIDGMSWIEYVIIHPNQLHRAIIIKEEKEYVFIINAAKFNCSNHEMNIVVLENITKLQKLASTDKLTKIANRIKLDEYLKVCDTNNKRYSHIFSVILLDIDHFKDVNDTYGHLEGDRILQELALVLKNNTRELDLVGRWGGEEFLIVCKNTDIESAYELAQKIRKKIKEHDFQLDHSLSASFGVSSSINDMDLKELMQKVDKALYQAKESGRDRVVKLV